MAINCCRYCNDGIFINRLNRFRIEKGPHSRTEDALDSLIACLSCVKPEAEIRDLVEKLTTESEESDRGITIHTESLMNVGSEFEYGLHNNMYLFNSRSIVGLLMALSNALNLKIFVFCGRLPMKILHQNTYVLQFNYGNENATKVAIGLVGLTIFHKLNQPEDGSSIWDALIDDSFNVSETMLQILTPETSPDVNIPNTQSPEISEDGADEPIIRPPVPETGPNTVISNVKILDFIQCNTTQVQGNRIRIESSAYNSTDRIDFNSSSASEFDNEPIAELNHLFDIDGLFCFHDWENSHLFKGDVVFLREPLFNQSKPEKTFKRLLSRTRNSVVNDTVFFKIGVSTGDKNIVYDLFFAAIMPENNAGTSREMIESIFKSAFHFGIDAPCYDINLQISLHPGCESRVYRSVLDAHTPNTNLKKITLSNDRYKCFSYHFFKKVNELFEAEGIHLRGCYQYIQAVGTKNKLYSNSVNGIASQIDIINATVEVDKVTAYYDVAFSVLAKTNCPETKVIDIMLDFFFLQIFIGIFIMERRCFSKDSFFYRRRRYLSFNVFICDRKYAWQ